MSKIISGFFYQLLILSVFLVSCKSEEEDASMQLLNIIQEVDNFKVEGTEKHPLGNYEKELYKKEADFAQQQLQKLESLNPESLTETERISSEL